MRSTAHSAEALAASAMRASQRERDAYKLAAPKPEIVPKGFRTVADWRAIWNIGIAQAGRAVRVLLAQGKMTVRTIKVKRKGGARLYPTRHYKLA